MNVTEHDDHVDRLYGVAQAIRILEDARDTMVREARDVGLPWQSIATALGVTRQGAQQKYAKAAVDPAQMSLLDRQDPL